MTLGPNKSVTETFHTAPTRRETIVTLSVGRQWKTPPEPLMRL